jgi:hypothetical protein
MATKAGPMPAACWDVRSGVESRFGARASDELGLCVRGWAWVAVCIAGLRRVTGFEKSGGVPRCEHAGRGLTMPVRG